MSGTRRTSGKSYGTTAIASSPWIVVSVGVAVMVVLLAIALGAYRGRGPAFDAQPGPPLPTVGVVDPEPSAASPTVTRSPRATATQSGRSTTRPTPTRSTPARSSTPPSPTPTGSEETALVAPPSASRSPLTGRYRVVESYADGFVGEVLVGNTSSAGREWTTRLTFPGARLGSAWIEGAPQGTAQRIDDGFTYRSGGDLPGGASVTLRFYVQGTQSRPTSCTVDGVSCRL
ncbi:cellulose binding domain-containing protein [Micromonospora sp. DSM 115977]|uniref:Cellulose binding domain-containing protein n=1 Tax=Micromonospora reichwaldensis TaxID=3075516 RepID=A0ABU2X1J5_9ACTN|nr:cellulose binding domain-containing protein [Micromonospora sp. DSM 115977]MDT0532062.1 cellulose binding domain-containing protein [Micromonospora sp. DSM 115977]